MGESDKSTGKAVGNLDKLYPSLAFPRRPLRLPRLSAIETPSISIRLDPFLSTDFFHPTKDVPSAIPDVETGAYGFASTSRIVVTDSSREEGVYIRVYVETGKVTR